MEALMVGGPRQGHMVTVSGHHYTNDRAVDPEPTPADDIWPPTFVDLVSGTTYRRFPLHYAEMSTLVANHVATRWDAVVYLHESIKNDGQVSIAFPQAAALWWFRQTGIPSNPNDPPPVIDGAGQTETEETEAS